MAEVSGLMKYKNKAGDVATFRPITSAGNIEGLSDLIEEAEIYTKGVLTAGSGAAYTATVPGITALEAGISFIMIPHVQSTSQAPTLNVNGLGAKNLRMRISGNTATTTIASTTNWISTNKPIRVLYDGMFWVAELVRPNVNDLYGTLSSDKISYDNTTSGLAASNVKEAIDELSGGTVKSQTLTTSEYDALETKDSGTLYVLTDSTEDPLADHIADTTVHVTADEKAAWDAKASESYVDSAIEAAIGGALGGSY